MKRSEMEKFIAWYIDDQLVEDSMECAADLLDHLEYMGMLPPRHVPKFTVWGEPTGVGIGETTWEKEDE